MTVDSDYDDMLAAAKAYAVEQMQRDGYADVDAERFDTEVRGLFDAAGVYGLLAKATRALELLQALVEEDERFADGDPDAISDEMVAARAWLDAL